MATSISLNREYWAGINVNAYGSVFNLCSYLSIIYPNGTGICK